MGIKKKKQRKKGQRSRTAGRVAISVWGSRQRGLLDYKKETRKKKQETK